MSSHFTLTTIRTSTIPASFIQASTNWTGITTAL
jgi:hypothetical protein